VGARLQDQLPNVAELVALAESKEDAVATSAPVQPQPDSTETCVSMHPGSVCCTVTTVQRDNVTKTVVIRLTTTVRCVSRPGLLRLMDGGKAGTDVCAPQSAHKMHEVM
jgi:hypothetical protein